MEIIFLSTHPKQKQQESGLPLQEMWIQEALGGTGGSFALKTYYASDEPLPSALDADAVIIGGSAHSVYEHEHWIAELTHLVKHVIDAGTPVLGICFGHQLIAQALGGTVRHAPKGPEIGAVRISLTEEGKRDWLFEGIGDEFVSAMLHHDLVTELPNTIEGTELACNRLYRNQAIAYADHVRTVQFHPEFTSAIMSGIIQRYSEEMVERGSVKDFDHADHLIKVAKEADFSAGKKIFENFYRFAQKKSPTA